jgi:hypothetical protein
MGGLTSSITTGDGGFSSAGPPRPNCRPWQDGCGGYNYPSNNNGGGWGWKGNGGNNNGWPYNNNDNGWNNGYQGGETSTIVTTSGPGGITGSSQSYNKVKRHDEPKSEGYGSRLSGLFGNYGYGKPRDAPVASASMGGLTSSITLGDHKKRQIATDLEGNGVAVMGGLESSITLEGQTPSYDQSRPAYDGESSYKGESSYDKDF